MINSVWVFLGLLCGVIAFSGRVHAYNGFSYETPLLPAIDVKTETATFNHLFEYAIHREKLWYRPKNQPISIWEVIPFETQDNAIPISLRADGANLMVLDSKRRIHYKKVILEKRNRKSEYSYEDINALNNWGKNWFSFPLLSLPQRLLHPQLLQLPPGVSLWSISHRGEFNDYFEDIGNKKHSAFSMVTTLYIVSPDGEEVIYADPFMLKGLKRQKSRIPGPKPISRLSSKNGREIDEVFKIDHIDSSASTVVIAGRFVPKNATTLATQTAVQAAERRAFFKMIDYDLDGRNPFLPAHYSDRSTVTQEWQEIELPVTQGKARLDNPISIFQTGMGNSARELRVSGFDSKGTRGYYHKMLNDADWNFVADPFITTIPVF